MNELYFIKKRSYSELTQIPCIFSYNDQNKFQVNSVLSDEWLDGIFGDSSGSFPSSHCSLLNLHKSTEPYGVS